jgi:hypothetical protein
MFFPFTATCRLPQLFFIFRAGGPLKPGTAESSLAALHLPSGLLSMASYVHVSQLLRAHLTAQEPISPFNSRRGL